MDTDSVADWTSGGMGVEEDLVFAKITPRLNFFFLLNDKVVADTRLRGVLASN